MSASSGTVDHRLAVVDSLIRTRGLSVTYATGPTPIPAVEKIDLTVAPGEFVCIIGPSGCGKSTLLHCLGGLLRPSRGSVYLTGMEVVGPIPRVAAFVFQDYSLLPWKSVLDNVSIGLRFAGVKRALRNERALEQLRFVGLEEHSNSYPGQLSGGMQQRVAVARALAMDPEVLLMDEPFGALDEQTRRRLGFEMAELLSQTSKTVVMVTHSLDEAIFWADRVIVMASSPGRIRKILHVSGTRPRSASFIDTEEFNRLRSQLWHLLSEDER